METLLIPTGVVALAEIGDKTQLLAFILGARFKRPVRSTPMRPAMTAKLEQVWRSLG